MATSGSTDFSMNRNDLISAALRKLRRLDPHQTAKPLDITTGAQILNVMLKSWQMDDVMMWVIQEAVLHLEEDGQTYDLGPSGDHFCSLAEAGKTQLSADSAASDTTLEVDSITGIADGDYIGIELDSGALEWTTVNGAPAGSTVTITTGVTSAASEDNYVFHYTNKMSRPLEIIEARIRDVDDNDEPLEIDTSLKEFMRITDKTSTGDAQELHLIPTITNSKLFVWPVCDNVTKRIVMTVKRVIEDFDASGDDADFPPEAYNAVIWNLAVELAAEYGVSLAGKMGANLMSKADETYIKLKRFYRSRENVQIMPG